MDNTLTASMRMMIDHGRAVTKAAKNSFIIVDLPFGSYESSKDLALENAKKIIDQTKCDAIKIETDEKILPIVEYLTKNNINVMGHIGLMPQHIKKYGGYKYQGINKDSMQEIINNAKSLEKSGAFSFVIEAVPAKLSDQISKNSNLITIGIGASRSCDGQILVIDDLLGLNSEFSPRFLKKYHNLEQEIINSVQEFCNEVKARKFPFDNNYF
jgi:3-methyl-2-oxobutanoate hydroxymethyltransferase